MGEFDGYSDIELQIKQNEIAYTKLAHQEIIGKLDKLEVALAAEIKQRERNKVVLSCDELEILRTLRIIKEVSVSANVQNFYDSTRRLSGIDVLKIFLKDIYRLNELELVGIHLEWGGKIDVCITNKGEEYIDSRTKLDTENKV